MRTTAASILQTELKWEQHLPYQFLQTELKCEQAPTKILQIELKCEQAPTKILQIELKCEQAPTKIIQTELKWNWRCSVNCSPNVHWTFYEMPITGWNKFEFGSN